jgi:prepilin-type N-terminal cleavage/methylation domain-containing protein
MRTAKGTLRSQSGFTLMEMLVAVTLVAIMAVSLWAVFRISIRSWSRGTEFMDANQRHRSILSLVRKQMASSYALYAHADPVQAQAGIGTLIFNGTQNSLQFISLNSLQFQESPGLTLVSYEVAQDSNGEYSLVEKEARYLGRMPEEGSAEGGSKATPIFENLSSCLFEYYDPGDINNPPQWVREWDGQKMARLPQAVSFTLLSLDPRGNTLNRHMVVPVKSEPYDMRMNFINPFGARGFIQQ